MNFAVEGVGPLVIRWNLAAGIAACPQRSNIGKETYRNAIQTEFFSSGGDRRGHSLYRGSRVCARPRPRPDAGPSAREGTGHQGREKRGNHPDATDQGWKHRVSGSDHFVRFVELKQVEAEQSGTEGGHYTYTEHNKAGEIPCRIEPVPSPIKKTTVYTEPDDGTPRITKVVIKGENVAHIL